MNSIKHKGQRVGVFIDTQNIYHGAKNLYNAKVNFQNIMIDAVGGRDLIRAIAYVINTDSSEEKTFFDALEKMGIEAKIKDIQIFSSGSMKADWDMGLAIDTIRMGSKLDVIILVSGDGDFSPLVDYLQSTFGCRVEAVAFGKSASGILRDKVDTFLDLAENPSRYLISRNLPRNMSRTPVRTQSNQPTIQAGESNIGARMYNKKKVNTPQRPKSHTNTASNSSKIIRVNLNEANE